MLGWSEWFRNSSNQAARNGNAMWIYIQVPFNENRMKISIKKSTFDLTWNYLKLSEAADLGLLQHPRCSALQ